MPRYIPARELAELAHHCAGRGSAVIANHAVAQAWHPEWNLITGGLEWKLRAWHTPGSTCNVFVHGLLSACGCAEPWATNPLRWPPKPNAIRLWSRDQEIRGPKLDDLDTVCLLVWRAKAWNAHIGIMLSALGGQTILTAEGGQPGGKIKRRQFGYPDYAVPLDRLRWGRGAAPTVGGWRETNGLPPASYATCEEFIDPEFLAKMDAPNGT